MEHLNWLVPQFTSPLLKPEGEVTTATTGWVDKTTQPAHAGNRQHLNLGCVQPQHTAAGKATGVAGGSVQGQPANPLAAEKSRASTPSIKRHCWLPAHPSQPSRLCLRPPNHHPHCWQLPPRQASPQRPRHASAEQQSVYPSHRPCACRLCQPLPLLLYQLHQPLRR